MTRPGAGAGDRQQDTLVQVWDQLITRCHLASTCVSSTFLTT